MRAAAGRQTLLQRGQQLPTWVWAALAGLIVGLGLGIFYAWMINPVVITDVDPVDLRQDWKEMWTLMAADSYVLRRNPDLARTWFSTFSREETQQLITRLHDSTTDVEQQQRFQELAQALNITIGEVGAVTTPVAPQPSPQPRQEGGGLLRSLLTMCALGLLVLLVVLGGAVVIVRQLVRRKREAGELLEGRTPYRPPRPEPKVDQESFTPIGETTSAEQQPGLLYQEEALQHELEAEPPVDTGPIPAVQETSLGHFTTRYQFGDDDYDMSFSIETPDGTFLGECGVSISEILLDEPRQHVTAFEVWLFDKDDIRTDTKVLLSEYAWQDDALQAKLRERGELVLVKPGEIFELETESLRVRVRVRLMEYGTHTQLPPNSFFSRLELDLEPLRKASGGISF
ncbi:MAG: hypothetical protein Q9O62_00130 [Ardenticatenia bacterium]|nr:hypothetical protein [Ardenticatenia bacterium]